MSAMWQQCIVSVALTVICIILYLWCIRLWFIRYTYTLFVFRWHPLSGCYDAKLFSSVEWIWVQQQPWVHLCHRQIWFVLMHIISIFSCMSYFSNIIQCWNVTGVNFAYQYICHPKKLLNIVKCCHEFHTGVDCSSSTTGHKKNNAWLNFLCVRDIMFLTGFLYYWLI